MSSRLHKVTRAAALAAVVVLCPLAWHSPALAQSDDVDPEVRIQQLENQLRQLTGQNEELQYRNRQLEERLKMLQGGAQAAPQGAAPGQPGAPLANTAALPPAQPPPVYQQPPGGYQSQVAAPAPIVQEPAGVPPTGRRRGDAFDPSQNPNAPGAPRALGGGQLPVSAGGRPSISPIPAGPRQARCRPRRRVTPTRPARSPPCRPRQRPGTSSISASAISSARITRWRKKPCATFNGNIPSDPLMAEAQFWLGESFFQRQQYRDAAEAFLAVTTKFDRSTKAPDALLRLGQSLGCVEGKGSGLRRIRRGDAEISARRRQHQTGRRPRAKAGKVLAMSAASEPKPH